MARWYDHLLTLLPFELPYFERRSRLYLCRPPGPRQRRRAGRCCSLRQEHGIAVDDLVIAALPGSRGGEVRRLLPIFGKAL
jgi:lipid-A-disaccharide synthase